MLIALLTLTVNWCLFESRTKISECLDSGWVLTSPRLFRLAVGSYREGRRKRATLPAILPSHHHTIHPIPNKANDEPERRKLTSRELMEAVAEVTMPRRRASITQIIAGRKDSCSKSTSDKGSSNLSVPERRGSVTTRRGSRGSLKRNSIGSAAGVRQWIRLSQTKDSLTEAEEKERAKKLLSKFRTWAQIVQILSRIFKKCSNLERTDAESPFYAQLETIDETSLGIDKNHYIFFDPADYKANIQMRMSAEGQRILSKDPKERTEEELHHVMIALRGIKMIEDLPVRMQKQLAKYGTFESYGPKRIIIKQHQHPDAYYFIIFGTVLVAVLQESGYAKTEVELTRGHSFGELAIMNDTQRQSTVISKTDVELLSLSEENYRKIFMVGGAKNFHDPDQVHFLSNLTFLNGWPLHLLTHADPKMVTFAYFRCNTVLVKDSKVSEWIIIVKSGSVTVLKKLVKSKSTLNKHTGRYYDVVDSDAYSAFRTNDIAYRRYLSYHNKTSPHPFTLSADSSFISDSTDVTQVSDVTLSSATTDDIERLRPIKHVSRTNRPMTCLPRRKPESFVPPRISVSAVYDYRNKKKRISKSASAPTSSTRTEDSFTTGTTDSELSSPRRIRTFIDDLHSNSSSKMTSLTEADLRPQFVLVQNLSKGQVFGLSEAILGGQPSMCVVSNGAECLLINRRFYLDNCPADLLRKLKTQVSPYPSEAKLQRDLRTRIDWDVYKQTITQQVLAHKTTSVPYRQATERNLWKA